VAHHSEFNYSKLYTNSENQTAIKKGDNDRWNLLVMSIQSSAKKLQRESFDAQYHNHCKVKLRSICGKH
jgi:hypothetical protein